MSASVTNNWIALLNVSTLRLKSHMNLLPSMGFWAAKTRRCGRPSLEQALL